MFDAPVTGKILMIAGEESGDVYGGRLARNLLKRAPGVKIEGIGGPRMREAGVQTYHDISEMAAVGFLTVISRIGFFRDTLNFLKRKIAEGEYDAVILIDFPDFNIRVAKAASKQGVFVFYYVLPQLWAWRTYRVKAFKKAVDAMFVVFPFEEKFYISHGANAKFSGHPILDELEETKDRKALRGKFGIDDGQTLLGVLPGSRMGEVNKMLPIMLEAVKIIDKIKPVRVIMPCAESIDETFLKTTAESYGVDTIVVKGDAWDVMTASDFLICKSGTSTLQAAIAQTPMVIVYKADMLSYLIAKTLSHTKWAGLPNILAGKEIVPEFLQNEATPQNIADTTLKILGDPQKYEKVKNDLAEIRASLGNRGAGERVADMMMGYLRKMWSGN